jgi:hypothetical protein
VRSVVEVKIPRAMQSGAMRANQLSTWFSQRVQVGVSRIVTRGYAASQCFTACVLCADRLATTTWMALPLGAIQRVDCGLLVDAEHDGVCGRRDGEPDDVRGLRLKVGIGAPCGPFEAMPREAVPLRDRKVARRFTEVSLNCSRCARTRPRRPDVEAADPIPTDATLTPASLRLVRWRSLNVAKRRSSS